MPEHKPWCKADKPEHNAHKSEIAHFPCTCATPHYKRGAIFETRWVTDTRRVGMGYHLGRRTADRVNVDATVAVATGIQIEIGKTKQEYEELKTELASVRDKLAKITAERDRINGLLKEARELLDKHTEQLVKVSSSREDAIELSKRMITRHDEMVEIATNLQTELGKAKQEYEELKLAFEAADAMHKAELDVARQEAFASGFESGIDHNNLPWKYPAYDEAWAEYLEDIKVNHYRYHTKVEFDAVQAELAKVTAERDEAKKVCSAYSDLCQQQTAKYADLKYRFAAAEERALRWGATHEVVSRRCEDVGYPDQTQHDKYNHHFGRIDDRSCWSVEHNGTNLTDGERWGAFLAVYRASQREEQPVEHNPLEERRDPEGRNERRMGLEFLRNDATYARLNQGRWTAGADRREGERRGR